MALQLRDYQKKAIEKIRQTYAKGTKKVILQLATGAGKTATFAEMLKLCHQKGRPALMVVRGAKLVHQASSRLTAEGVPHGIYQANNTKNNNELIQIASIDTLYARRIAPPALFIVFDECHLTNGESYKWLTSQQRYEKSYFLGVSATPFSATGLTHIGATVVYPITIQQLIERGYLVGARYRVPYRPNLKGVKKSGGEYNSRDLMRRLAEDDEQQGLHGSLIKEYQDHCAGRRTLLFAVNVAHAHELGEQLGAVGARTAHIDGNTPHQKRDAIIAQLENQEIDVITSVGVMTTGVDIPSLECLLVCRPTASYNLWIQMLGRGTRPHKGKDHFLVVDLAGNTLKFGPIEAEMVGSPEATKEPGHRSNMTSCEECFAAFTLQARHKNTTHYLCPACGADLTPIVRDGDGNEIEHDPGELIDKEIEPWEIELPSLVARAKEKGYKKGYVFHQIKSRYGLEAAEAAWRRIKVMKRWPSQKAAPRRTPDWSTKYFPHSGHAPTAGYGKTTPAQQSPLDEVGSLRDLLGSD